MLSPVFQWRGLYSLHSHLLASNPPPQHNGSLLLAEDMPSTTTTTGNNSGRKRKLADRDSNNSCSLPEVENNSLPFSRLMRLMAAKYQEKEEAEKAAAAATAEALAANAAAALFSPFLPYLPPPLGAGCAAEEPAEKRLRTEENIPLDLSRGSTPELDVGAEENSDEKISDDKASVVASSLVCSSPSSAVTSWPVERVAQFVEQIEECREYGRLFRDEKIDGSCLGALSLYHLTAVLRIKIGPALKILKAVQALHC
jgi:pyruvate/2-oxoglutarate dehydrogenase complex dihydrolipoamide acyltransferase (E2) component